MEFDGLPPLPYDDDLDGPVPPLPYDAEYDPPLPPLPRDEYDPPAPKILEGQRDLLKSKVEDVYRKDRRKLAQKAWEALPWYEQREMIPNWRELAQEDHDQRVRGGCAYFHGHPARTTLSS